LDVTHQTSLAVSGVEPGGSRIAGDQVDWDAQPAEAAQNAKGSVACRLHSSQHNHWRCNVVDFHSPLRLVFRVTGRLSCISTLRPLGTATTSPSLIMKTCGRSSTCSRVKSKSMICPDFSRYSALRLHRQASAAAVPHRSTMEDVRSFSGS